MASDDDGVVALSGNLQLHERSFVSEWILDLIAVSKAVNRQTEMLKRYPLASVFPKKSGLDKLYE